MGIQGLLPFLKKIHQPVNIADFQGCTVAIDAYCWLHKGAFSCAEKLALGEKTDQYVYYCMKYIDYMLRKNLKPILVFDGCHLMSKADVEKTRRQRRELHRKKAAQFLREGKRAEAKECLQRCIDISPQMALDLMNACRNRGVDCIVAPYEADAQLAYLSLQGIAQIIVTEDSDLLLFGCDKIIFKMDFFGNGTLIEKSRLNEVLAIQGGSYTFEKFRYMCILSGCDYLPSLPGIGLVKASKVFKTARQPDLKQLLKKLPTYLKMNLTVTDDYVEGFIRANNTFLYQLVYDPLNRKLCPLNPYSPGLDPEELFYAGKYLPDEKAYQIALGNIDIHDHKCIAFFDPDTFEPNNAAKPKFRHQLSIWDKNYRIKGGSPCKDLLQDKDMRKRLSLHDKEETVKIKLKVSKKSPMKRPRDESSDMKSSEELMSIYNENEDDNKEPDIKKVRRNLMDPDTAFNLLQEDQDDQENIEKDFFLPASINTSTPQKGTNNKRNAPLTKNVNDYSDDENRDSDEELPKRGRKRKMSGTPSKLTAANIGEETFKAASKSSEKKKNSQLTPDKSKNMFAVPENAVKPPRFNLNAPALQVKSRYFHSNGGSTRTASPSKKKSVSPAASQKSKTSEPKQNNVLEMLRNAPVLPKTNVVKQEQQAVHVNKKGMHKYLTVPGVEKETARETFKALKNVIPDDKGQDHVKLDNTGKEGQKNSLKSPHTPSILDKFQSRFSKTETKGNVKRPSYGSAFGWTKTKLSTSSSGKTEDNSLTRLDDLSVNSEVENKITPLSRIKNEALDSDLCNSYGGKIKEFNSTTCPGSEKTVSKTHLSLSSYFGSSQSRKTSDKIYSSRATGERSKEDLTGEITELKSYDYNDYIKSLEGESPAVDHAENQCSEAINDGKSENVSGASQNVNKSLETSIECSPNTSVLSLAEDTRLSCGDSQKSNLWSIDSDCFPTSQDFIDLTDNEASSQNSSVSSVSRSSSTSGQSVCRVSGLSRNRSKAKPSKLQKANSATPGQRSIKDLMGKFQYARKPPNQKQTTRSTSTPNVDEDEMTHCKTEPILL